MLFPLWIQPTLLCSLLEASSINKLVHSLLEAAREISEKRNFFVNRSVPENFQRGNFSRQVPTESLRVRQNGLR